MSPISETELQARLRILLPATYDVFDDEVQPTSMGSVGLKYGPDGKVLWNEMWGSFCDLAMAGGPPHRGSLLRAATAESAAVGTANYSRVAGELCRGLLLVTGLHAEPASEAGWLKMYCTSAAMASWLARAIVMENVSAIGHGLKLLLPTGSMFRVEKEIKNVITAVAKTSHYWLEHMTETKHDEIAHLIAAMDREAPLIYPSVYEEHEVGRTAFMRMARAIHGETGLPTIEGADAAWIGLECRTVMSAIWMMRALAVINILARREGTIVFLPVSPAQVEERSVRAVVGAYLLGNSLAAIA